MWINDMNYEVLWTTIIDDPNWIWIWCLCDSAYTALLYSRLKCSLITYASSSSQQELVESVVSYWRPHWIGSVSGKLKWWEAMQERQWVQKELLPSHNRTIEQRPWWNAIMQFPQSWVSQLVQPEQNWHPNKKIRKEKVGFFGEEVQFVLYQYQSPTSWQKGQTANNQVPQR